MANELSLSIAATWLNGNYSADFNFGDSLDVTGTDWDAGVQNIGTSEEALVIKSDVTTPAYVFLRNMDATNYVQAGTTSADYGQRMTPDATPVIVMALDSGGGTIYLKANTAACDVQFLVLPA